MDTTQPLAKVICPAGTLEYGPDRVWRPVGDSPQLAALAELANVESNPPFYSYSPGHGRPGALIAQRVAARIKGAKVELPEVPPGPPGRIY